MSFLDFIGVIASVTSVAGFLPQICKIHQTKSVEDLSIIMLFNFLICSLAWIIYGVATESTYVSLTNIAGLLASCVLLIQKMYHQK